MLLGIHHLILTMTQSQAKEFEERFLAAGFTPGDTGSHPGAGTANTSVLMREGAFVEFAWSEGGGGSWYEGGPRIGCLGFCSTDIAADAIAWADSPTAWTHRFERETEHGERQSTFAASPLPRDGFYVFIVDRPHGKYFPAGSDASLTALRFTGEEATLWERRLERWLQLRRSGASLFRGDIELSFVANDRPGIAVSATFVVPTRERTSIPLADGELVLLPAAEAGRTGAPPRGSQPGGSAT